MSNVTDLRERLGLLSMPTIESTSELVSDVVEGRGVVDAAFGILFALGQGWTASAAPVLAPAVRASGFVVSYDAGRDMVQIATNGDRALLDSALESGAVVASAYEGIQVSLGTDGALAIPTAAGGTFLIERDSSGLRTSLYGSAVDGVLPAWAPAPVAWLAADRGGSVVDAIRMLGESPRLWDRVAASGLVARHPEVVAPSAAQRIGGDHQRPWLLWVRSLDGTALAVATSLAERHALQLESALRVALSSGDPMSRSWWARLDALRIRREQLEGVAVVLGARGEIDGLSARLADIDREAVIALAIAPEPGDASVSPLLAAVGAADPSAWWGA